MSARPFMRLASPTVLRSPTTPRSILIRPAALPLSPSAFSAGFSIHVAPSVTSPLASAFSTFSPNRPAISPNPLTLPKLYGDAGVSKNPSSESLNETFYTPTAEVTEFKLDPPPPVPEITKPAKVKQSRASIRFQQTLAAKKKPALLPREDLSSALLKFPRSPYPTAATEVAGGGKENISVTQTQTRPKTTTVGAESSEHHNVSFTRRLLSPVEELSSAAEDRLNQEFWRSVRLEEEEPAATTTTTTPMLMFGTKDGALWSPGFPRKTPLELPIGLPSVLSPLSRTSFANKQMANPQAILSPVPNDPFSGFPSFTAVLSTGVAAEAMITYPPRAVVEH